MTGTAFPTDYTKVSLFIDGVQATTLNVTDTLCTFLISTMTSFNSSDVRLITDHGLPLGYSTYSDLTLDPVLTGISPSVGSAAGSLL